MREKKTLPPPPSTVFTTLPPCPSPSPLDEANKGASTCISGPARASCGKVGVFFIFRDQIIVVDNLLPHIDAAKGDDCHVPRPPTVHLPHLGVRGAATMGRGGIYMEFNGWGVVYEMGAVYVCVYVCV